MPPWESVGAGSVLSSLLIAMFASTVFAVASVVKNRLVLSAFSPAAWPSLLKFPFSAPSPVGSKNWSPASSVSSGSPHGAGAAPAGAARARPSVVRASAGRAGRGRRMVHQTQVHRLSCALLRQLAGSQQHGVEHFRGQLARERVLLAGVKAAHQPVVARRRLGGVAEAGARAPIGFE